MGAEPYDALVITAAHVRDFVTDALAVRVDGAPRRFTRGFGNDNWRVATAEGDLVVKVSRPHLPGEKLAAAARAQALAYDAGVPVPKLIMVDVHCEALAGRAVRVQEFVPGAAPSQALQTPGDRDRFFRSAGAAVARLHAVPLDAFASRVGGQPAFPSWAGYLRHRVPQIGARIEAAGGIGLDHEALFARVLATADEVSAAVSPALTHRDLHLDNLVVAPDGTVAALLDFDLAEAWDPVVDLVKLRWLVEPVHPGAERAFLTGYGTEPAMLAARLWIVEVIELANTIANAVPTGDQRQAASARERLARVNRTSQIPTTQGEER